MKHDHSNSAIESLKVEPPPSDSLITCKVNYDKISMFKVKILFTKEICLKERSIPPTKSYEGEQCLAKKSTVEIHSLMIPKIVKGKPIATHTISMINTV